MNSRISIELSWPSDYSTIYHLVKIPRKWWSQSSKVSAAVTTHRKWKLWCEIYKFQKTWIEISSVKYEVNPASSISMWWCWQQVTGQMIKLRLAVTFRDSSRPRSTISLSSIWINITVWLTTSGVTPQNASSAGHLPGNSISAMLTWQLISPRITKYRYLAIWCAFCSNSITTEKCHSTKFVRKLRSSQNTSFDAT